MPGGPCQALLNLGPIYVLGQGGNVLKGNLGKQCARCHSPNGWGLWEFDHGKETGLVLSGAHGKRACEEWDRCRSTMTWQGPQVR